MGHYENSERPEVLTHTPRATTVLDVGCLQGSFGAALKHRDPGTTVWGVEFDPESAAVAAERLDHVIVGRFPEVIAGDAFGAQRFECITFLDCLEHLVDPWTALTASKALLADGGRVVASIPNVRNAQVVMQLVRGRWDYKDNGILDRTHLRFFTRNTMREMFESTGFRVDTLEPINLVSGGRLGRTLRLFGRRAADFRAAQFVVVATPVAE